MFWVLLFTLGYLGGLPVILLSKPYSLVITKNTIAGKLFRVIFTLIIIGLHLGSCYLLDMAIQSQKTSVFFNLWGLTVLEAAVLFLYHYLILVYFIKSDVLNKSEQEELK
ncbi:hypothetical protein CS009_11555 [Streptococcus macedonicus]|uniref:Uncharacterized protein n=1 Tax=Streptococcus macedonicus TaxID=59310 RepID=A0A2G3NNY4_STRMC|nr:hypothetical protein [Streptococcus macedonicus]PHV55206.1 hypothetical protein CS009_11555 [Streptococcus macedonicus]PHV55244.1 hypothetical protein CS010_11555 [Streptococcus macedonicus]